MSCYNLNKKLTLERLNQKTWTQVNPTLDKNALEIFRECDALITIPKITKL